MRHYLDGHIGDIILLIAFLASLGCFTVTIFRGAENQYLASITLAAMASLGTYMTKRGTSNTTVENVEKVNMQAPPPPEESARPMGKLPTQE